MIDAIAPGDIRATIHRGGARLAAHLLLPVNVRPAAVIFVHGLGSGKGSPRNVMIAERLRDAGIAALLFELSGHGESSNDIRGEDIAAYSDDVAAAFSWLHSRDDVDGTRIGIAASSLGGLVALDALRQGVAFPASMVPRAPPVARDLEDVTVPTLVLAGTPFPNISAMTDDAACPQDVDARCHWEVLHAAQCLIARSASRAEKSDANPSEPPQHGAGPRGSATRQFQLTAGYIRLSRRAAPEERGASQSSALQARNSRAIH